MFPEYFGFKKDNLFHNAAFVGAAAGTGAFVGYVVVGGAAAATIGASLGANITLIANVSRYILDTNAIHYAKYISASFGLVAGGYATEVVGKLSGLYKFSFLGSVKTVGSSVIQRTQTVFNSYNIYFGVAAIVLGGAYLAYKTYQTSPVSDPNPTN